MRKFLISLVNILFYTVVGFSLIMLAMMWDITKNDRRDQHVQDIYAKLCAQTGQIQDKLPLKIVYSQEVNAYNDGKQIVIFTGMLQYVKNDDELALVLGHETAHGMLRHVYYKEFHSSVYEVSVAEANADKLGAVYIMKAGYDICKAREVWKRMSKEEGNYQGGDHPTYIYRYEELNIGCE